MGRRAEGGRWRERRLRVRQPAADDAGACLLLLGVEMLNERHAEERAHCEVDALEVLKEFCQQLPQRAELCVNLSHAAGNLDAERLQLCPGQAVEAVDSGCVVGGGGGSSSLLVRGGRGNPPRVKMWR